MKASWLCYNKQHEDESSVQILTGFLSRDTGVNILLVTLCRISAFCSCYLNPR